MKIICIKLPKMLKSIFINNQKKTVEKKLVK